MKKSDFQLGMEVILNNPKTSILKNSTKVLDEICQSSGMSLGQMIKTVGKSSKTQKKKEKEPTDDEKSYARLQNMSK